MHYCTLAKIVSKRVFEALENERCLDLYFRRRVDSSLYWLPNYKLMKQVAVRNKLGPLYIPFVVAALAVIPILNATRAAVALIFSLFPCYHHVDGVEIIATSKVDFVQALSGCEVDGQSFNYRFYTFSHLSRSIGFDNVLTCCLAYFLIVRRVLSLDCGQRRDLWLHSYDAFLLSMLTLYIKMKPRVEFVTDDHYQRFAYLMSHMASNFTIVQHGYLDEDINFVNPFGSVKELRIVDSSFRPLFERYYTVKRCEIYHSRLELRENKFSTNALFLASSYPAIDAELEVLRRVKEASDLPIIVKLHPCHKYDLRKEQLLSYASLTCNADDFPQCSAFLSYNSFLEHSYRSCGVPTFSIAREGIAGTAESIVDFFATSKQLKIETGLV